MRVTWPREKRKEVKPENEETIEQAGLMETEPENTDEKEMNNADLCNISTE